jgi:hypothetical protein
MADDARMRNPADVRSAETFVPSAAGRFTRPREATVSTNLIKAETHRGGPGAPFALAVLVAMLAVLLVGVTSATPAHATACPDIQFIGDYPGQTDLNWSENVQGIAHDDTYWFVTNKDHLHRIPLGADLRHDPSFDSTSRVGLPPGYNHFGDIDQYGGYVFVPLQGDGKSAIAAYDADLVLRGIVDVTLYQGDQLGWLAVNPVAGDLYTSGNWVSSSEPMTQYHLDLAGLRSTGSLVGNLTHVGPQSVHEADGGLLRHGFGSMQGGAFTPTGDLFISNGYFDDSAEHYRGGIHLIGSDFNLIAESTNGYGDFNYEYHPGYDTGDEPEGIDWFANAQSSGSPGVAGDLHALLLDNDWPDGDDLLLKHYSVDFSCRDTTPPVVVGAPDRSANGAGWYDAPVTIDWRATDDSGTASDPSDTVAGTEGRAVSYVSDPSCDPSGNCATGTVSLSVDLTDPAVQCQPATFQLHQPNASIVGTVSDALSGPVAATVTAPVNTNVAGAGAVALTGVDRAGRHSTVACPYSVAYKFEGFFTPVDNPPATNRATAGQVIAVKWRLTDYGGGAVDSAASFVQLTSGGPTCSSDPTAAREASNGSGLRYLRDGTWQFNWQTQRSYAGQCRTIALHLADGTTHTAKFQFR